MLKENLTSGQSDENLGGQGGSADFSQPAAAGAGIPQGSIVQSPTAEESAYPSNFPSFSAPTVTGTAENRSLGMQVGQTTVTLGLHQPIYRNLDNQPAKILKVLNMAAAILLIMAALYRFIGGAGAHIKCNQGKFNEDFCGGKDCKVEENPQTTEAVGAIDCKLFMDRYISVPADGFTDFIITLYVLFLAVVNLTEEVKSHLVDWFMKPMGFMGNLSGRGLYYLFVSSLVMTKSHSFLTGVGGTVMAIGFLYLLIYVVVKYTAFGDRLGVHAYQEQDENPAVPKEQPAPAGGGPTHSVV